MAEYCLLGLIVIEGGEGYSLGIAKKGMMFEGLSGCRMHGRPVTISVAADLFDIVGSEQANVWLVSARSRRSLLLPSYPNARRNAGAASYGPMTSLAPTAGIMDAETPV
jgi:hypothetical protein